MIASRTVATRSTLLARPAAADHAVGAWLVRSVALVAVVVAVLSFLIWVRGETTRQMVRVEELRTAVVRLEREQRRLEVERAWWSDPARLRRAVAAEGR